MGFVNNFEKYIRKYLLFIIIGLSIPVVWSLFVKGYFGVSDDLHIGWLFEMDRAIKSGQIPPRFVPDLSFGFGYPLFNFTYPLPFYLGEIFHLLGLSLVGSLKAVFVISIPLSMYFMYYFLREWMDENLSLLGAVVYVYAPYRATDMFVRGAVGEIVSFIFLPLLCLSFIKIVKDKSWRWVGISALSMAGLLLSHNITAYMFIPFVGVLVIFTLIQKQNIFSRIIYPIGAGILGLIVSSYFWLPALVESKLVKYSTVFDYFDHFPTLKQLITPYFGYGASVPGPYDGMSFFLGLTQVIIIVLSLAYLLLNFYKINKENIYKYIFALATLGICVFMMNYRSSFLWDTLPLIKYFQFPWRFLTLSIFVIPMMLTIFSDFKYKKEFALGLIVLTVASSFIFFRPEKFIYRDDAYYINRYIPVPVASEEYKKTGEEYLRLPKNQEVRPNKNYPRAYSDGKEIKNIKELNALDTEVEVSATKETVINFNKYNFPGWEAKIDGVKTNIVEGKPFAQITVLVPAGDHIINVYYQETNFRKIFDYLSLFGILVALLLVFIPNKKHDN